MVGWIVGPQVSSEQWMWTFLEEGFHRWVRVGLKPVTSVLIRRGQFGQRESQKGNGMWRQAKAGEMNLNQGFPGIAGHHMLVEMPKFFGVCRGLHFWTFSSQNCENMHFCYLEPFINGTLFQQLYDINFLFRYQFELLNVLVCTSLELKRWLCLFLNCGNN